MEVRMATMTKKEMTVWVKRRCINELFSLYRLVFGKKYVSLL